MKQEELYLRFLRGLILKMLSISDVASQVDEILSGDDTLQVVEISNLAKSERDYLVENLGSRYNIRSTVVMDRNKLSTGEPFNYLVHIGPRRKNA